jgi:putative oxidoreductase
MKALISLITLSFLPSFNGLGLLLLRVWVGGTMFYVHGLDKLKTFGEKVQGFEKMGFHPVLGSAAVLSESVFAILIAIGLATRWSAALLGTTMAVAFWKAHGAVLIPANDQEKSGEMAFIYCAACVAIFLLGPGRFSLDAQASRKSAVA